MPRFLHDAEIQVGCEPVEQLPGRATAYVLADSFWARVSLAIKDRSSVSSLTKFNMNIKNTKQVTDED